MLHKLTQTADHLFQFDTADAHCDIPCKIYDPSMMIIPALSVVRMIDIMTEAADKEPGLDRDNTIARCVAIKEMEASKVKEEARVIWGDYFKAAQIDAHPNVHTLVHSIMMAAGKCKQTVDRPAALELVELVNQFAEMFWATKGVETERKDAPYPPSLAVVYPKL